MINWAQLRNKLSDPTVGGPVLAVTLLFLGLVIFFVRNLMFRAWKVEVSHDNAGREMYTVTDTNVWIDQIACFFVLAGVVLCVINLTLYLSLRRQQKR